MEMVAGLLLLGRRAMYEDGKRAWIDRISKQAQGDCGGGCLGWPGRPRARGRGGAAPMAVEQIVSQWKAAQAHSDEGRFHEAVIGTQTPPWLIAL